MIPDGAEFGITDDNLLEIEGASTHEDCMTKSREAKYPAFAMKGDKCFGYTAGIAKYPPTKELDTSYTACSDPAMMVADMCKEKLDEEMVESPIEEEQLEIEYEKMKGYILHNGKGIDDIADTSTMFAENAKDITQCKATCDEDEQFCVGFIYDSAGVCKTLTNETVIPPVGKLDENTGGALYHKLMAPNGYEMPAAGKDHSGKPINISTDSTIDKCAARCDENKACVGFSMFDSGKCMLRNEKSLDTEMFERPTGSTFYKKKPKKVAKKKTDLMKPMEVDIDTDAPGAANDAPVVKAEPTPVSGTEKYRPDWLAPKSRVRGMGI